MKYPEPVPTTRDAAGRLVWPAHDERGRMACGHTFRQAASLHRTDGSCGNSTADTGIPGPWCATCAGRPGDAVHQPGYSMHRVPWDIPGHPYR